MAAVSIALTAISVAYADTPRREIALDASTDHIEGWLDARGEISVFPDSTLSRDYDPYASDPGRHCVTVVTETLDVRDTVRALVGKHVRVWGRPVLYDALDHGTDPYDTLLSRRYYKTLPVHNFCLRDYIFVAHRFEGI